MATGGMDIDEHRNGINSLFGPNDHFEDEEDDDVESEDMELVHINHKVQLCTIWNSRYQLINFYGASVVVPRASSDGATNPS